MSGTLPNLHHIVTMAIATNKQGNEVAVVRINTQLSNKDYERRKTKHWKLFWRMEHFKQSNHV